MYVAEHGPMVVAAAGGALDKALAHAQGARLFV